MPLNLTVVTTSQQSNSDPPATVWAAFGGLDTRASGKQKMIYLLHQTDCKRNLDGAQQHYCMCGLRWLGAATSSGTWRGVPMWPSCGSAAVNIPPPPSPRCEGDQLHTSTHLPALPTQRSKVKLSGAFVRNSGWITDKLGCCKAFYVSECEVNNMHFFAIKQNLTESGINHRYITSGQLWIHFHLSD